MSKLKQEIKKEQVLEALKNVLDKELEEDIVTAGLVSSVVIKGNTVGFAIEVDMEKASEKEYLRKDCEKAVKSISGVEKVTVVMTSARNESFQATKPTSVPAVASEHNSVQRMPGIKNIILVASGKGGVGKSMVSVNLATSLAKQGYKVGIVDADIYGPSIPKMLGLIGKPEIDTNKLMVPKEKFGIKSISIGYLVDEGNAVVWRSSMALKAMFQLLKGVSWGELDYMIIDTPPGTGDIQLSLVKNFPIKGVVLVSTPQEMALIDVKKAANMFKKTNTPVIGIVENMSYFEDPVSGNKSYIFGKDGVKNYAKEAGINFLGEIPIKEDIRKAADSGLELKDNFMQDILKKFEDNVEKLS